MKKKVIKYLSTTNCKEPKNKYKTQLGKLN